MFVLSLVVVKSILFRRDSDNLFRHPPVSLCSLISEGISTVPEDYIRETVS